MDELSFKRAVRARNEYEAPTLDAIIAARRPRRLRTARLAGAVLAAALALTLVTLRPAPDRAPDLALAAIPTTDWLLDTPDAAFIATLAHEPTQEN